MEEIINLNYSDLQEPYGLNLLAEVAAKMARLPEPSTELPLDLSMRSKAAGCNAITKVEKKVPLQIGKCDVTKVSAKAINQAAVNSGSIVKQLLQANTSPCNMPTPKEQSKRAPDDANSSWQLQMHQPSSEAAADLEQRLSSARCRSYTPDRDFGSKRAVVSHHANAAALAAAEEVRQLASVGSRAHPQPLLASIPLRQYRRAAAATSSLSTGMSAKGAPDGPGLSGNPGYALAEVGRASGQMGSAMQAAQRTFKLPEEAWPAASASTLGSGSGSGGIGMLQVQATLKRQRTAQTNLNYVNAECVRGLLMPYERRQSATAAAPSTTALLLNISADGLSPRDDTTYEAAAMGVATQFAVPSDSNQLTQASLMQLQQQQEQAAINRQPVENSTYTTTNAMSMMRRWQPPAAFSGTESQETPAMGPYQYTTLLGESSFIDIDIDSQRKATPSQEAIPYVFREKQRSFDSTAHLHYLEEPSYTTSNSMGPHMNNMEYSELPWLSKPISQNEVAPAAIAAPPSTSAPTALNNTLVEINMSAEIMPRSSVVGAERAAGHYSTIQQLVLPQQRGIPLTGTVPQQLFPYVYCMDLEARQPLPIASPSNVGSYGSVHFPQTSGVTATSTANAQPQYVSASGRQFGIHEEAQVLHRPCPDRAAQRNRGKRTFNEAWTAGGGYKKRGRAVAGADIGDHAENLGTSLTKKESKKSSQALDKAARKNAKSNEQAKPSNAAYHHVVPGIFADMNNNMDVDGNEK